MAIVQVSRITHRKGLSENLPQLAGAELGWVIDQRKLYIGNGTIAEGAPAVGNTEVLTEYSDILNIAESYTYKGDAGGYTVVTGPTAGSPIGRTLQQKFDDFASVKDFGAVGDGVTDDTAAINRALFQLFCREVNTSIRRSLFFPAGTYRVTDSINIPPYAKLWGEGGQSSIVKLDVSSDSAFGDYAARTADSNQATGASIGDASATPPQDIQIAYMGFQSDEVTDLFLIEDSVDMSFVEVSFIGPLVAADLTGAGDDIACVRFDSTASLVTSNILFDGCLFKGCTWGFDVDEQVKGIKVANSKFDTLYRGAQIGAGTPVSGGPVGFSIVQCVFDNIPQQGIIIGDVNNNMSGYNAFLDVGNNFQGVGSPITTIIDIQGDNNVSVGDMFERDENDNASFARIELNSKRAFALDKGERYKFGTFGQEVGKTVDLTTQVSPTTIFTLTSTDYPVFTVQYSFQDPVSNAIRYGRIHVVSADSDDSTGTLAYTDEYQENNITGLVMSVSQTSTTISVQYTATDAGAFKYTVSYLG